MIRVGETMVEGWQAAIRGMRNPYNSWAKSDSCLEDEDGWHLHVTPYGAYGKPDIGEDDLKLMSRLANAGDDHGKFMRMITVTADVCGPHYWWKEYDTYKVGTVANSCSTMHTIMDFEFQPGDFSYDQDGVLRKVMPYIVKELNDLRYEYILLTSNKDTEKERKAIWEAVIQLLPESYNQVRTIQTNYQVLKRIYRARAGHPLKEWEQFRKWIESLPYAAELITVETGMKSKDCKGCDERKPGCHARCEVYAAKGAENEKQ